MLPLPCALPLTPLPSPLTAHMARSILVRMAMEKPTQASDLDLSRLEFRVTELIQVCERLKDENRSLRQQHQGLLSERAGLIEKNEQVRGRIEAMINRLRAMERNP